MSVQFNLRRGLTIPLAGEPEQQVCDAPAARTLGIVGLDYLGLRHSMQVEVGDRVRLGQTLFTHKKLPGVRFTAPGSGEIAAINLGPRRVLQSVVIRLDQHEETGTPFDPVSADRLGNLDRGHVIDRLLNSGLWVALRTRPFSKIPAPDTAPAAIFVNAMDSNPLAADPTIVLAEHASAFTAGLEILSHLTNGDVHVCHAPEAQIELPPGPQLKPAIFDGPHPAGLAGTHIHFLEPVSLERTVWTIGYQDVIAFGKLFTDGVIWTERVISLSGPVIKRPRLLRTRLGASVDDLIDDELPAIECRIVSGSPLSGRRAVGFAAYLGRYHNQITALAEGRERELFGWIRPGFHKYSATRVFVSKLLSPRRKFALTTSQQGSPRAMVPLGIYESVMPQDTLPTQLLRALLVRDTEMAQKLGCLELDEEDLALCSFVSPGKYDYGPALRDNLDIIEREG